MRSQTFSTMLLGLIAGLLPLIGACRGEPPVPAQASGQVGSEVAQPPVEDAVFAQVAPLQRNVVRPVDEADRLAYEQNTIDVFRNAAASTVFVTQRQVIRDGWSFRAQEIDAGSGTGFVWDRQGHIVTNYHVIDGGRSFYITLQSGKIYPAKLVGGDPHKDIAVLKIEATGLVPVRLPQLSSEVTVGQKAVAIGNPFGLDHTLTVGVVSALGREVKGFGGVTIRDMIQTDASINPGNSGGPLLDSQGQLIGMNTMIFSKSGSSAGIGFAVPVKYVRRVVPQIIRYGQPKRAGLGIRFVDDVLARRNGIVGVVIEAVEPGTPAQRAGLRGLRRTRRGAAVGDVIVAIDGKKVESFDDLYNALDDKQAGQKVVVRLEREGSAVDTTIELIELSGRR